MVAVADVAGRERLEADVVLPRSLQERPLAAAEVELSSGATRPYRRHNGADPLVMKAHPLLDRRLFGVALYLPGVRIGGILLDDELAQRFAGQVGLAGEI